MDLGESAGCAVGVKPRTHWLDVALAACALAIADVTLCTRGLPGLSALVSRCPVRRNRKRDAESLEQVAGELCRAVDSARKHHVRPVECLPRSAALTCLLRLLAGRHAQVVIGVRRPPFAAHAWVEVDGVIVSDAPTTIRRYEAIAKF